MEDKEKQYLEWLSGLKVGDKWLVVTYRHLRNRPYIYQQEVTGETPKFWKIGGNGRLASKENGMIKGGAYGERLHPPSSSEEIEKAMESIKIGRIAIRLKNLRWEDLSLETLRKVTAIIDGEDGKNEA